MSTTVELRITIDASQNPVEVTMVRRDEAGELVRAISPLSDPVLTARLSARIFWQLELASEPVHSTWVRRPEGDRPGHIETSVYPTTSTVLLIDVPVEDPVAL